MPEPEVTAWLTHTATALLGGGVGALALAYLRFRGGISTIWRDERANVENEWARQLSRANAEIDKLTVQADTQRERIDKLLDENIKYYTDYVNLKAEMRVHEAEGKARDTQIALLTAQLERLTKTVP